MYAWTVMVYMAGDNSLANWVIRDINDMEAGAPERQDQYRVVIQADRGHITSPMEPWAGAIRCPLWRPATVVDGKISTKESEREYLGDDIDFADPQVLKDFVRTVVSRYEAERYMLVLWSHGYGVDDSQSVPTSMTEKINENLAGKGISPLSASTVASVQRLFLSWKRPELLSRGVLEDTRGTMSNASLSQSLREIAGILPRKTFDLLAFDACSMSGLEIACQVADVAHMMIGSENIVPPMGLPFQAILNYVRAACLESPPTCSPESLAQHAVNSYEAFYSGDHLWSHVRTLTAIRLPSIPQLVQAVDRYAQQLICSLEGSQRPAIRLELERIHSRVESFSHGEFVDIGHFAKCVMESTVMGPEVRMAARQVVEALSARDALSTVVSETHSPEDRGHKDATGLTVFFPTFDNPKMCEGYSTLEFVRWSWDEFLKTCFDVKPVMRCESTVESEVPGAPLRPGSTCTVRIHPRNIVDLSHTPSKLMVLLSVDEFFRSHVSVEPRAGVSMAYNAAERRYEPSKAVFHVRFDSSVPPITYVMHVALTTSGGELAMEDGSSVVHVSLRCTD
jgi:hypothetical protein